MVRSIALLLALAPLPAGAVQIQLAPGETLLEIEATGETSVAPDLAEVGMGVVSTGTTAREATDANARQMAAVIAAVRGAGIEARYIRTQQINVQPRFARNDQSDYEGQARITGYVARNSVAVTIVRLSIAPAVIAAGFGAGANSVSGPDLQLRNRDAALAAARRDALSRARAEADAYATGLGMKVTRVLRVSERGQNATADIFVTARRMEAMPAPPPPPPPDAPVSAGELRQTVEVWIDYALAAR